MTNPIFTNAIRHGGDIQRALELYGGKTDEWLDLSTGISPWSYPVPALNDSLWRDLPSSNQALITAASRYYGCAESQIITTPGSQLAIRLIPQFLDQKQTVAIPLIGYQEHAKSWQIADHLVTPYRDFSHLQQLVNSEKVANVVLINPNNPSGEKVSPEQLSGLSKNLVGLLLIDEAFSDVDPSSSVCSKATSADSNIVVLKSLGKFFGLAGARVGFAIGVHPIVAKLNQLLSPWSMSGPSIKLAASALNDTDWQVMQRQRITENAEKQKFVLGSIKHTMTDYRLKEHGLFFSVFGQHSDLTDLHTRMAEQKIWTRLGDPYVGQNQNKLNWLRLSLAGDHLHRLSVALKTININKTCTNDLLPTNYYRPTMADEL